jgi:hypothetical protein
MNARIMNFEDSSGDSGTNSASGGSNKKRWGEIESEEFPNTESEYIRLFLESRLFQK